MTGTRRDLLRATAALGGTAVLGSMGGCLGSLPIGGSPAYEPWLYEPGAVGDGDAYSFEYFDAKTVRENEDRFDGPTLELIRGFVAEDLGPSGVDTDELNGVVSPGAGRAYLGSFGRDPVVDDLKDGGYEEESADAPGFDVYVSGGGDEAFGVREGTLLTASSGIFDDADPVEIVETLAKARANETDRYAGANEDFGTLLEYLGDGFYVSGGVGEGIESDFDDQVGTGTRFVLGDGNTEVTVPYLFEDASDVEPDEVRQWVEENENTSAFPIDIYDVSVSKNGRAAVVEAKAETDELFA